MWYIGLFFLVRTMAFFLSFFVLFCFSGLTTLPVPPSFFLSFFISISWSLANLFLFLSLSLLSLTLSPPQAFITLTRQDRQDRQTVLVINQSIFFLPPSLPSFQFSSSCIIFFFFFPFFCAHVHLLTSHPYLLTFTFTFTFQVPTVRAFEATRVSFFIPMVFFCIIHVISFI